MWIQTRGWEGGGSVCRKVLALCRRNSCTVTQKRSGLGIYCRSNIIGTLGPQWRRNPRYSTKLCQTAGESCQCECLSLYCSSLYLLQIHSCFALTHCVSSSNPPPILSCLKLLTQSHITSLSSTDARSPPPIFLTHQSFGYSQIK